MALPPLVFEDNALATQLLSVVAQAAAARASYYKAGSTADAFDRYVEPVLAQLEALLRQRVALFDAAVARRAAEAVRLFHEERR